MLTPNRLPSLTHSNAPCNLASDRYGRDEGYVRDMRGWVLEKAEQAEPYHWWAVHMPGGWDTTKPLEPYKAELFREPEGEQAFFEVLATRRARGQFTRLYTGGEFENGVRVDPANAETRAFFQRLRPYFAAGLDSISFDYRAKDAVTKQAQVDTHNACQLFGVSSAGEALPCHRRLLLGRYVLEPSWLNKCPWLCSSDFLMHPTEGRDRDQRWTVDPLTTEARVMVDDSHFEREADAVAYVLGLWRRGFVPEVLGGARGGVVEAVLRGAT